MRCHWHIMHFSFFCIASLICVWCSLFEVVQQFFCACDVNDTACILKNSNIFANSNLYSKRLYPRNQGVLMKKNRGSKIAWHCLFKEKGGGVHWKKKEGRRKRCERRRTWVQEERRKGNCAGFVGPKRRKKIPSNLQLLLNERFHLFSIQSSNEPDTRVQWWKEKGDCSKDEGDWNK
jgi:hypothetical protein